MSQKMNETPTCPLCAARALSCDGDCLATLQQSTASKDCGNEPAFPENSKGGPRTAQGKAVAARNATTHGLFARDVVLPSLGEDPEGYNQLEAEWTTQIAPRNLLERHYVEKIAAASWRLRRLHRWQAQLFEDDTLTEDERLNKLDKVLRHETNLHRQIDTSIKMLNKDVPQLYKGRARARALVDTMQTEIDCRENRENELEVEFEAREQLKKMEDATAAPALDLSRLDAAPNCQNEPAPASSPALSGSDSPPSVNGVGGGGVILSLAPLSPSPNPLSTSQPTLPVPALAGPEGGGVAGLPAGVGSSGTPLPRVEVLLGREGLGVGVSTALAATDFGILLASQLRDAQ